MRRSESLTGPLRTRTRSTSPSRSQRGNRRTWNLPIVYYCFSISPSSSDRIAVLLSPFPNLPTCAYHVSCYWIGCKLSQATIASEYKRLSNPRRILTCVNCLTSPIFQDLLSRSIVSGFQQTNLLILVPTYPTPRNVQTWPPQ